MPSSRGLRPAAARPTAATLVRQQKSLDRKTSAGACAVSDTFTTRPGTKLGTWPVTVMDTVDPLLPVAVALGSSR